MIKGSHHTEEHKKKISLLLRGDVRMSYWKGKKLSQETKEKMRIAHTGEKNHFFGKKHSSETLKKISEKHKRENLSAETLKKMSDANKDREYSLERRKKISEWMKKRRPIIHTEESKRKNREAHLGKKAWNKGIPNVYFIGKKNPRWKGGITKINNKIRHSLEYKLWREAVFKRDNWTCVLGGKEHGSKLNADHIRGFADFPELRFVIDNGRTLCLECHKKTDNYGNRKKHE